MSQENVEIVRRVYEAIARLDAETVLSLYDPDVTWDATRGTHLGGLVGAGIYHGHKGLSDWARQWDDAWEDSEWSPDELIDAGEDVVVVVSARARGRASGAKVEGFMGAGVWSIRDGKIVRVVWFQTRDEAFEAAGLNE
jgi:ketosteroid isomerase-like protein